MKQGPHCDVGAGTWHQRGTRGVSATTAGHRERPAHSPHEKRGSTPHSQDRGRCSEVFGTQRQPKPTLSSSCHGGGMNAAVCLSVCPSVVKYAESCGCTRPVITVELAMPQTQSSVDISKSSFRLTYSLKVARGIFGADVLTSSNFQDFVCNV